MAEFSTSSYDRRSIMMMSATTTTTKWLLFLVKLIILLLLVKGNDNFVEQILAFDQNRDSLLSIEELERAIHVGYAGFHRRQRFDVLHRGHAQSHLDILDQNKDGLISFSEVVGFPAPCECSFSLWSLP